MEGSSPAGAPPSGDNGSAPRGSRTGSGSSSLNVAAKEFVPSSCISFMPDPQEDGSAAALNSTGATAAPSSSSVEAVADEVSSLSISFIGGEDEPPMAEEGARLIYSKKQLLALRPKNLPAPGSSWDIVEVVVEREDRERGGFSGRSPRTGKSPRRSPKGVGSSSSSQQQPTAASREPLTPADVEDYEKLKGLNQNRWVPKVMGGKDGGDTIEDILRHVQSILNKMTFEKFEKLSKAFLEVGLTSEKIVGEVISILVGKAQAEPHFSKLYADLCLRMSQAHLENVSGKKFKTLLLEKCQEEFEKDRVAILQQIQDNSLLTDEEKAEKMLKEKQHHLGHMQFIGALYEVELLKEKVVHFSIGDLMSEGCKDMDSIECMVKLMTTVGPKLDQEAARDPKSAKNVKRHFKAIKKMADDPDFSSRLRFMLRDLLELRESGWVARREVEKAKTIAQLHQDVARETGKKPPSTQSGGNSGAASPASPSPSEIDDGWEVVVKKGKPSAASTASSASGKSSPQQYSSKGKSGGSASKSGGGGSSTSESKRKDRRHRSSGSGKGGSKSKSKSPPPPPRSSRGEDKKASSIPPRPPAAKPAHSEKDIRRKGRQAIEEFAVSGDIEEAIFCIRELDAAALHWAVVSEGTNGALEKGEKQLQALGLFLLEARRRDLFTAEATVRGFQDIIAFIPDLVIDVPRAGELVAHLLGPLLAEKMVPGGFLMEPPEDLVQSGKATLFAAQVVSAVAKSGVEDITALAESWSPPMDFAKLVLLENTEDGEAPGITKARALLTELGIQI